MQIRETFATAIQKRIEPVVKVVDRRPSVLLGELSNLVVTPQWEKHLRSVLDAYADAAERDDEQSIGIWVSGFFGSGKSLLVKVLGIVLEGADLEGQSSHDVFLDRLPGTSPDRDAIRRYLTICKRKITTTVVGGNLHAMQASRDDPLALIAFKLFALQRGFTQSWPLAWAIEHQIDARGLTADFRQRASDRGGAAWEEIAADPEFYMEHLYAGAADVLPEHFSGGAVAVERSVNTVLRSGIDPAMLIDRLRRWCAARDGGGRRHKLLLQLDEVGQWIASGNANERTMQVQALIETAAAAGEGRLWIAVTAHGDVQALQSNVQQEQYAKINQRFAHKCKLSNEDISQVVEERLLRKTQPARVALQDRFTQRMGDLSDMGTMEAQREYPIPNAERFALFYPYMPWTVAVIPDVVKGIAQAAGRDEALTGSNRTMIGVVQGAIIETPGLLEAPIGRMLSLADLYDQLASDAPIETKTDLNRVRDTVPGATDFTPRVARALYLLGEAEYLSTTLENVARSVVDSIDADLATIRPLVRAELDRLVKAGYVKHVGEQYIFLSTQQRGFQDRVRARQEELQAQTYELSQALKEYDSDDALRFDKVAILGREIALKLDIDGRVARNPTAHVTLRVYSPFQRALDPQIGDDTALKQRSTQEANTILVRLGDVPGLRAMIALALATDEVATQVTSAPQSSDTEKDVARQAKQVDLASHKAEVRRLLGQSVRGATIFFQGTPYQPAAGESPSAAIRTTLGQILPHIYARFADVPHRISNEETAVKAALAGNTTNSDLQALSVYRADGTLNDAHPLLSTIRSRLPIDDQYQQFVQADALRTEIDRPPYGWDPNGAKVALALLLRASSCRLIDTSKTLTDPNDPDVVLALTKETKFKNLRVQGVKSELGVAELQQIRGYIETLFHTKPALVAATLNTVLGDRLNETAKQAQEVQQWAATAQCPLPLAFDSGNSLVTELLNNANPVVRLPRFHEQADTLINYVTTLQTITAFQRDHGADYTAMRDLFNQMVYADSELPPVRHFIDDWRTVASERGVTDPARWNELTQAYRAAQKAIADQIATWKQDATAKLAEIEAGLEQRVRAAGVPEEQMSTEVAALSALFQSVRDRLAQQDIGFAEARGILTSLANADMTVQRRVGELREQYQPVIGPPSEVIETTGQEVRLRWSDLVPQARIASEADVERVLSGLRERLLAELGREQTFVLE